jgi:hypothetical protein
MQKASYIHLAIFTKSAAAAAAAIPLVYIKECPI